MKKYYCHFPVRDAVDHIESVMDSLINQSVPPSKIIPVDDGSTDGTSEILKQYQEKYPDLVEVIRTESKTRDFSRLPSLWNMAIRSDYEYQMVSAGDVTYEKDYAKKILERMDDDDEVVIASGDVPPYNAQAPHGGGRFIKQSFFDRLYPNGYPGIIGYESELLVRALMDGKKIEIYNDIKIIHHDKLGHTHNFSEFGIGMKTMGYYPPYAILRCLYDIPHLGTKACFNMFKKYVTFTPKESGYYSKFPDDIRNFNYQYQKIQVRLVLLGMIVKFGVKLFFLEKWVPKKHRSKVGKWIYKKAREYQDRELKKIGITLNRDQGLKSD